MGRNPSRHPRMLDTPWTWIPSLYFTEGIPYVFVMTISAMLFKRLGMDNIQCAFYTSWLYLPWVIQPVWTNIARRLHSDRWWIWMTQLLVGVALASMAFAVKMPGNTAWILACLWLIAFSSATHDTAADYYYKDTLSTEEQGLFIGVRSKVYYISVIAGQGLILMLAGGLETYFRDIRQAWFTTIGCLSACILLLALYHLLVMPRNYHTEHTEKSGTVAFFRQKGIGCILIFILLFILPKALTAKINIFFLIDPISQGGLGLSLTQIGFAQGTIGIIGLSVGSIMSNNLIARDGLRKWFGLILLCFTLPQLLYVYICNMNVTNFGLICVFIFIEQYGYGLGLTAYFYYMLHLSRGEHESHYYSICTALMALGMTIPGIFSGWIQTYLGYNAFYILAAVSGIVTLAVAPILYKQIKTT